MHANGLATFAAVPGHFFQNNLLFRFDSVGVIFLILPTQITFRRYKATSSSGLEISQRDCALALLLLALQTRRRHPDIQRQASAQERDGSLKSPESTGQYASPRHHISVTVASCRELTIPRHQHLSGPCTGALQTFKNADTKVEVIWTEQHRLPRKALPDTLLKFHIHARKQSTALLLHTRTSPHRQVLLFS